MPVGGMIVMAEGRRMMRLSRELPPERFEALLVEFQTLLRELFQAAGGQAVDVDGDTVTAHFPSAREAALAALQAQRAVAAHAWPPGLSVAMSIGLDSSARGCEELCDAAEAGQVFVSPATATLLGDESVGELVVRDLGEVRTRRTDRAVRAHELVLA